MKESGIDKLIELLNEYEDGMVSWVKEYSEEFGVFILNTEQMIEEEIIISKSFGFIGWLVENDKIDRSKVLITFSMAEYDGLGNMYGHGVDDNQRLLMILAISDTPIKDLVSYLR